MAVQTRIQIRRGTLAQWNAAAATLGNGILYQGEIGYETDTGRFKIGDGSTAWGSLAYASVLPSSFVAGSGISLSQGSNGSTVTISLSNPNIQVSNITDFAEGVDDRVASLLTSGSGIGLSYNDNSNTLSVGITGIPSSLVTNFDAQVRTNRLDQMASPTASVSFNSQKVTNLADPTNDQDAATKAYVDAARSGLDVKQSVRVATTGSLVVDPYQAQGATFRSDDNGGVAFVIDGITLQVGDRVLVKNQTDASKNGIYNVVPNPTVGGGQALSRAPDANSNAEVTAGMFTFVAEGTTNADSGWVLTTNDAITLETTGLTFAQFSGAGQITAGAGMTKSGNTLDVGTASSSRIVVNADNIDLATVSRSDLSSAPQTSFIYNITTDSYGRLTGTTYGSVADASTSTKGIASFDSGDFSVAAGAVSIKVSGVGNSQLENSSLTVGSTNIALGGTSTTLAGLSSVTSTSFVGALTGNASTATALQNARTINGASFDGTSNITIQFVDGGTP